jgi:hypothetical protein
VARGQFPSVSDKVTQAVEQAGFAWGLTEEIFMNVGAASQVA